MRVLSKINRDNLFNCYNSLRGARGDCGRGQLVDVESTNWCARRDCSGLAAPRPPLRSGPPPLRGGVQPGEDAGLSNSACCLPGVRITTSSNRNRRRVLRHGKHGAPGEIRTPGLLVRSQALYPTELRAQRRSIQDTTEAKSRRPRQPTDPACSQSPVRQGREYYHINYGSPLPCRADETSGQPARTRLSRQRLEIIFVNTINRL